MTHAVSCDVYPIGTGATTASDPVGLLCSGTVDAAGGGASPNPQTPEDPGLPVFPDGLTGLGMLARRRRNDC